MYWIMWIMGVVNPECNFSIHSCLSVLKILAQLYADSTGLISPTVTNSSHCAQKPWLDLSPPFRFVIENSSSCTGGN